MFSCCKQALRIFNIFTPMYIWPVATVYEPKQLFQCIIPPYVHTQRQVKKRVNYGSHSLGNSHSYIITWSWSWYFKKVIYFAILVTLLLIYTFTCWKSSLGCIAVALALPQLALCYHAVFADVCIESMQTSAAVDSRFWVECSLDSVATLFSFCAVKIKIVSKCPVLKLYIAL